MEAIVGRGYTHDTSPCILSPTPWKAMKAGGKVVKKKKKLVKRTHTEIQRLTTRESGVQKGL